MHLFFPPAKLSERGEPAREALCQALALRRVLPLLPPSRRLIPGSLRSSGLTKTFCGRLVSYITLVWMTLVREALFGQAKCMQAFLLGCLHLHMQATKR
jgi:hypothetical protein